MGQSYNADAAKVLAHAGRMSRSGRLLPINACLLQRPLREYRRPLGGRSILNYSILHITWPYNAPDRWTWLRRCVDRRLTGISWRRATLWRSA
jgi:hypothetical protein